MWVLLQMCGNRLDVCVDTRRKGVQGGVGWMCVLLQGGDGLQVTGVGVVTDVWQQAVSKLGMMDVCVVTAGEGGGDLFFCHGGNGCGCCYRCVATG